MSEYDALVVELARRVVSHVEPAPRLEDQWLEAELLDITEPDVAHGRVTTQERVRVRRDHGEAFWQALADLYEAT